MLLQLLTSSYESHYNALDIVITNGLYRHCFVAILTYFCGQSVAIIDHLLLSWWDRENSMAREREKCDLKFSGNFF